MTRIIAGAAGGRRLVTPPGERTRPTSDRVREALFSMLEARGAVRGARVLDLFAGSGALGLEAASRGAAAVTLVDSSRQAVAAARRNAGAVTGAGGPAAVEVVLAPALRYLQQATGPAFDLVLLDPPYALGDDELATHLTALAAPGRLAPGAVVVVERGARGAGPRWPAGLVPERDRRYGETVLWTARWTTTAGARR
ncbi:MAG TPA: 16S rRNA (guanine(966)-N(2))-methyltransferase RsmD [Kineosporiaceae bacterium]